MFVYLMWVCLRMVLNVFWMYLVCWLFGCVWFGFVFLLGWCVSCFCLRLCWLLICVVVCLVCSVCVMGVVFGAGLYLVWFLVGVFCIWLCLVWCWYVVLLVCDCCCFGCVQSVLNVSFCVMLFGVFVVCVWFELCVC